MGHQKQSSSRAGQPGNQHAPTEKQKHLDRSEGKPAADSESDPAPKRIGMTRFEWTMSVLTLAGLAIAALTGVIFWHQLKEMRTEQRAWVSATPGETTFHQEESGHSVSVPITIANTGKTPGKKVVSRVVLEIVRNGESPTFDYSRPRRTDTIGALLPNTPFTVTAHLLDPASAGARLPRILTQSEYQQLLNGETYFATYGEITYEDIFGTHHWGRFCVFGTLSGAQVRLTAQACAAYNDVDDN